MSMLPQEKRQIEEVLAAMRGRAMLTQAAALQRSLPWAFRVYAELSRSRDHGNVYTFLILREDGSWVSYTKADISNG